jgi:lysyl-tRNA synthetase, class I
MVRRAFEILAPGMPTRLFCFSDDMDGLRKVPDNIPNKDLIAAHLGKPLTSVPDPFGLYESFGQHNNARLKLFLDSFGFEYEFISSTECYRGGLFDDALLKVLEHYDEIVNVILPTLGAERQATYSPFLPVSPTTGRVLQAPVVKRDAGAGTIVYEDEDGRLIETPVTGGACKLQWKADWAMRWYALQVDYEMCGKDLIESVHLSSRICRILGGVPPDNLIYEMFLDENGEKISKSKGNGLAVEEWLRYAPQESLAYFMYQKPQTAKRLYFDVIPRNVDDYLADLERYPALVVKDRLNTAVWHIHGGNPPPPEEGISFSILLNLVSACHSDDPRQSSGIM